MYINKTNLLYHSIKNKKQLIYVCPAMNTNMYFNPITKKQIKILKKKGIKIIKPIVKLLACGEYNIGAMEEISKIKLILTEENEL